MSAPEEDSQLIAAALDRAPGARRRLAQRLFDVVHTEVLFSLRRHAAAIKRDPNQEAHDLVQDVLVLLLENEAHELRRWDPERGRSLDGFVRLVTRRRVARIMGQRRGNPWANVPIDPGDIDDDPSADTKAVGLAKQLEVRNELGWVLDALYARMGARDLELFDQLFVEERRPGDVARTLGMTRQAVNAWSYRMRKLVRRLIEEIGEESPSSPGLSSSKEQRTHG